MDNLYYEGNNFYCDAPGLCGPALLLSTGTECIGKVIDPTWTLFNTFWWPVTTSNEKGVIDIGTDTSSAPCNQIDPYGIDHFKDQYYLYGNLIQGMDGLGAQSLVVVNPSISTWDAEENVLYSNKMQGSVEPSKLLKISIDSR